MSDFLYSTEPRPPGTLAAALRRWLDPLAADLVERHGSWGSLAVVRPEHERHALHEDGDALTVVVGNPVVRPPGDAPAPAPARSLRPWLHQALAGPESLAPALDGHFAALRVETRTGAAGAVGAAGPAGTAGPAGAPATLIIDRFAFVPVFHARSGAGHVLGTHPDAVAEAADRSGAIDLVSATDLCANLTTTFPWTLYDGVAQLAPGEIHRFTPGQEPGEGTVYWRPSEPATGGPAAASPGLSDLAARLRDALLESVAAATADADRADVLLSGGEDSRAVLAAVPKGVRARGVVYAEWESREVRVARRVARAYGAETVRATRAPDHYAAGFPDTLRVLGSGHHFVDFHGLGLDVSPPLATSPVVLGGLSADSLLKSVYAPDDPDGGFRSKRIAGVREELLEAVDERRNQALEWLRQWRPETALEWHTLWPFSMRKHGGNVDGNRRIFRSWEAFHATAVLDVAATAPVAMKRHRRLFHRAMRPLFARSAWIPHAEYRFPYLGRWGNVAALPALAAVRGARALATGELRVRHRPWPKWRVLAASEAMRRHEDRARIEDTVLAGLFDPPDAGAIAAAREEWYALRRLMLTQLGHVLRTGKGL